MRFERVVAPAFGPFVDQGVEFSPGLNVLHGANEAGKSSWLAAIYLGLCGFRRGKGPPGERERDLIRRHRPWSGTDWAVNLIVRLEDGRRIELARDLADRSRCQVTDADRGTNCAAEIVRDGSPDGSCWVGLERSSFLTAACVRQGEVLQIIREPEVLQEYLQRAADSPTAEMTAERALELIDRFRRERIGQNRGGSQRPRRRALDRVRAARRHAEDVRRAHEDYVELVQRAEEQSEAERRAQRHLRLLRAACAWEESERSSRLLREVQDLSERVGGEPPPGPAEEALLTRLVEQALDAADNLPAPPRLEGKTAADLHEELERLPEGPDGETEPAELVSLAHDELDRSWEAVRTHESHRPGKVPQSEVDRMVRTMAVGAMTALLAAVFVPAEWRVPGLALALTGGGLSLLGLSWAVLETRRVRRQLQCWQEVHGRLREEFERVSERLEEVLAERQSAPDEPPAPADPASRVEALHSAVADYERRCRERAQRASLATRRRELKLLIEARRVEERATERLADLHRQAWERLHRLAEDLGLHAEDDSVLSTLLRQWLDRFRDGAPRRQKARQDWRELDERLAGRSVDEVAQDAEERMRTSQALAEEFPIAEIDSCRHDLLTDETLAPRLESEAREASIELARTLGRVREREESLESVAAAEEELLVAEAELARLEELDRTLELAATFLTAARDRVHRDVAPSLARVVRRYLVAVTAGRYTDVRVDPRTLTVQVLEGSRHWRDATLVSQGTAEQIYLLLRAALVEHVAPRGEVIPLLLDDVTVNFDPQRKRLMLETLRSLAEDRQVILFTQETCVVEWASTRLVEGRDRVVSLGAHQPATETA